MQADAIIVRLGELTLKGRNRHRFEQTIMRQLRAVLSPYGRLRLTTEFARVYIELNGESYEQVAGSLHQVFGISSYSPARVIGRELRDMHEAALALLREMSPPPRTFKISAKRADKSFPLDSQMIAYEVGGYVLQAVLAERQAAGEAPLRVDVHRPEVEIRVDVRLTETYVYAAVEAGPGGYPYGSNGKAALMLSGGIDSPVAGWLAMRRGLALEAVHFHSYPYTSERARMKVVELVRTLSVYSGGMRLHLVPFTEIQTKLKDAVPDNLLVTFMKRAMVRLTERVAEKSGAQAIVTGESLGQVASQTLPSLHAIGSIARLPLLRPLIMSDKQDIIRMAETIGTYATSVLPYEDCCTLFLPKSPSTNPNVRVIERIEAGLDWLDEASERALGDTEAMTIDRQEEQAFDRYF